MSLLTNRPHDDGEIRSSTYTVLPLLNASEGVISKQGYSVLPGLWRTSVWLEQMGALHSHKVAAPAPDQPWGWICTGMTARVRSQSIQSST